MFEHAQAGLIRLLPRTELAITEWRQEMNGRIEEARASIRSEGVGFEVWFATNWEDSRYLVAVMSNPAKPTMAAAAPTHSIDTVHANFKQQAWDRSFRFESRLLRISNTWRLSDEARASMLVWKTQSDRASQIEDVLYSGFEDRDGEIGMECLFRHQLSPDQVAYSWFTLVPAVAATRISVRQENCANRCRNFGALVHSAELLLDVRA